MNSVSYFLGNDLKTKKSDIGEAPVAGDLNSIERFFNSLTDNELRQVSGLLPRESDLTEEEIDARIEELLADYLQEKRVSC